MEGRSGGAANGVAYEEVADAVRLRVENRAEQCEGLLGAPVVLEVREVFGGRLEQLADQLDGRVRAESRQHVAQKRPAHVSSNCCTREVNSCPSEATLGNWTL